MRDPFILGEEYIIGGCMENDPGNPDAVKLNGAHVIVRKSQYDFDRHGNQEWIGECYLCPPYWDWWPKREFSLSARFLTLFEQEQCTMGDTDG